MANGPYPPQPTNSCYNYGAYQYYYDSYMTTIPTVTVVMPMVTIPTVAVVMPMVTSPIVTVVMPMVTVPTN